MISRASVFFVVLFPCTDLTHARITFGGRNGQPFSVPSKQEKHQVHEKIVSSITSKTEKFEDDNDIDPQWKVFLATASSPPEDLPSYRRAEVISVNAEDSTIGTTRSSTSFPTHPPKELLSGSPTSSPTENPTEFHGSSPTPSPTESPTEYPTVSLTKNSTQYHNSFDIVLTSSPTVLRTRPATSPPIENPSKSPTSSPTLLPTIRPTGSPISSPTSLPTVRPTNSLSSSPTTSPASSPSAELPTLPTANPTDTPSAQPSDTPSASPTKNPSGIPTKYPTSTPSAQPSKPPTPNPTHAPSEQPSAIPSLSPTSKPSTSPTEKPSESPTKHPTSAPSAQPSKSPTANPTHTLSEQPSARPSASPSEIPTMTPPGPPSVRPSAQASSLRSFSPSTKQTENPSHVPTGSPSDSPSSQPTSIHSNIPTKFSNGSPTASITASPMAGTRKFFTIERVTMETGRRRTMDIATIDLFEVLAFHFIVDNLPEDNSVDIQITSVNVVSQVVDSSTKRRLQELPGILNVEIKVVGDVRPGIPPDDFSFSDAISYGFENNVTAFTDILMDTKIFPNDFFISSAVKGGSPPPKGKEGQSGANTVLASVGIVGGMLVLATALFAYLRFVRSDRGLALNDSDSCNSHSNGDIDRGLALDDSDSCNLYSNGDIIDELSGISADLSVATSGSLDNARSKKNHIILESSTASESSKSSTPLESRKSSTIPESCNAPSELTTHTSVPASLNTNTPKTTNHAQAGLPSIAEEKQSRMEECADMPQTNAIAPSRATHRGTPFLQVDTTSTIAFKKSSSKKKKRTAHQKHSVAESLLACSKGHSVAEELLLEGTFSEDYTPKNDGADSPHSTESSRCSSWSRYTHNTFSSDKTTPRANNSLRIVSGPSFRTTASDVTTPRAGNGDRRVRSKQNISTDIQLGSGSPQSATNQISPGGMKEINQSSNISGDGSQKGLENDSMAYSMSGDSENIKHQILDNWEDE